MKEEFDNLGVKEEFPEIKQLIPLTAFEKTERELLIQANMQLSKILKILENIYDKLEER